MKTFELDKDTKEMIQKISALSSVKADIIKQVWEYTAMTWLLQISEKPDKLASITIPYFGKIGVRFDHDKLGDNGELESEITAFVAPSKAFSNMVGDVYNGEKTPIIEYIQNNLLKNTIANCEEK